MKPVQSESLGWQEEERVPGIKDGNSRAVNGDPEEAAVTGHF